MNTSNGSPLVSIIMPVYNAEKYLREAIDSIIRQTYRNWELIIVNDGSVDGSQAIIDYYLKIDKRIRAYQQKNSGVVKAANYAASFANGEYISRADADDVSFDNKFENLIAVARKHEDAVVISGGIEVIDENGEYIYRAPLIPRSDDIKRALYFRNPLANGATMIKRSAFDKVGGYDDVFAEDCHLWIKLWPLGDFVGTGTAVYRWRINRKGLTFSNNALSVQKEKEYTSMLWQTLPPYMPRVSILQASYEYTRKHKLHGVYYKETMLDDLGRVGVHFIKHRQLWMGIKQMIAVASSGRTGLKIIAKRLLTITKNTLRHAVGIKDKTPDLHRPFDHDNDD